MRQVEDLWELRAERIDLLRQLTSTSNSKRQTINKRLMAVSKKIQRLCGVSLMSTKSEEI